MDFSKIKLIIWDLDDSFWSGTLSEGAVSAIQSNIEIVKNLTKQGVVNSVCSKNDKVSAEMCLKEIGVDQKMINKAIFTQVGVYFMLPLSLAIVHSIVGLKISSTIVGVFGNASIMPNIIITAIIFVIIYGGYFLATYLGAKKNINERS